MAVKQGQKIRCSFCTKFGHNRLSCPKRKKLAPSAIQLIENATTVTGVTDTVEMRLPNEVEIRLGIQELCKRMTSSSELFAFHRYLKELLEESRKRLLELL